MTITGTSHFVSIQAAVKYYKPYGYKHESVLATVLRKLNEGEIHIGKPALNAGEKLIVIDDGTRYAIESN